MKNSNLKFALLLKPKLTASQSRRFCVVKVKWSPDTVYKRAKRTLVDGRLRSRLQNSLQLHTRAREVCYYSSVTERPRPI